MAVTKGALVVDTTSSASTSHTATVTASVAVGQVLVMAYQFSGTVDGTPPTVTDTKGHTWTVEAAGYSGSGWVSAFIAWTVITTAMVGGSDIITATISTSSSATIQAHSLTGVDLVTPVADVATGGASALSATWAADSGTLDSPAGALGITSLSVTSSRTTTTAPSGWAEDAQTFFSTFTGFSYSRSYGSAVTGEAVTGTISSTSRRAAVAVIFQPPTGLPRTGSLAPAPALSAVQVSQVARTGNLAAAPVLTAVGTVATGPPARTGNLAATPSLSAAAVARLTRTGSLAPAPVLSATAVITRVSATGQVTIPAPVLTATEDHFLTIPPGPPLPGRVDLRLVAYAPNAASMGLLPTPDDFSLAIPLNDVPSLTVNYGTVAPRGSVLGQPLELAVEITGDAGLTWTEPPDCRFLYLRDGRDPARTADTWNVEAPGYVWRLQKAKVLAEGLTDAEGRRTFTDATPGAILATFWNEAQARGALSGMTLAGTASQDAAGAAWTVTLTRSYDLGADLLTILQDLAAGGYLDFRTVGRTLALYAPDGVLAADRTVGNSQVQLTPLAITEAPFRRTWEGLADFIQVAGDDGSSVGITNPTALKPWGRWEDYVTQGGVSDAGTLTAIGQRYQALTEAPRAEFTHGLYLGAGPAPLTDFWTGDYVWSRNLEGALTRYRVRQVTLQKDGNAVQGNVVVNDRFLESDIRTRRMLDAILGGASPTGSTGGPPTPPGPDILAPAAVVSLAATTASYADSTGQPRSQITLNWPDVTTNADATAMTDLGGYQVRRRKTGNEWAVVATGVPDSLWTSSPYEPATVWDFQVRAVDSVGNEGAWSPTATVTTSVDIVGPVKPSDPVLSTRLGGIVATWDGLADPGSGMDADTAGIKVHLKAGATFTPDATTYRVSVGRGGGQTYLGNLTYDTTYTVRFVPFDTSGNEGPASDPVSIIVKKLVDVSNFPDTAMEELYVRTAHFITVTADMVAANAIDGMVITGALVQTAASGERAWMGPLSFPGVVANGFHVSTGEADESNPAVLLADRFTSAEAGFHDLFTTAILGADHNPDVGWSSPALLLDQHHNNTTSARRNRATLKAVDGEVVLDAMAGGKLTMGDVVNGGLPTITKVLTLKAPGSSEPTAVWYALTLTAPWTNTSGWPLECRMDSAGTMHLRGRLTRNAATTGSVAANLPASADYRPKGQARVFVVNSDVGLSDATVVVNTDGTIQVYWRGTAALIDMTLSYTTL